MGLVSPVARQSAPFRAAVQFAGAEFFISVEMLYLEKDRKRD
jgi:hypothetical protein